MERKIAFVLGKDFKKTGKYSSKELISYLNKFYEKYYMPKRTVITSTTLNNLLKKKVVNYELERDKLTKYYFLTKIGNAWYQKIKDFEGLVFTK